MDTIYGVPFYESAIALTQTGGKRLAPKRWHKKRGCSYAKRIEKKWAKRYGPVTYKPAMYRMRDPFTGAESIVVHPSIAKELRARLRSQNHYTMEN